MSKAIFKTLAVLAAAAAFMLPGANRNTFAADAAPSAAAAPAPDEPGTRSFTLVSVEVDGTKFWLPSAIAVEQGDKVKLTLINNVPGAVVNLMNPQNVDTVFIAGKLKKWRGGLVDVDTARVLRLAAQARDGVIKRANFPTDLFS